MWLLQLFCVEYISFLHGKETALFAEIYSKLHPIHIHPITFCMVEFSRVLTYAAHYLSVQYTVV